MNFFKENLFGLIIGFIFGLITIPLAALGLVSGIAGLIGLIFFFPGPLIGQLFVYKTAPNTFSTSIAMPVAFLLNGIFYAFVGGLLQKWLKKKKYVIFIFVGWILFTILLIIIETIIRTSLGLHVGP